MEKSNYYYMVLNEDMQDEEGRIFKLNTQYSIKYSSIDNLCFEGITTHKHLEYTTYTHLNPNNRFFLVKSTGAEFNAGDTIFFCSNIKLIKEITRDMLELVCNSENEELSTVFICKNTNRVDVLEKHIHSPNVSIREAIAENPNTPLNMLKILIEDDSSKVLTALKETNMHSELKETITENLENTIRREQEEEYTQQIEFFIFLLVITFLAILFSL